uniref:Activating transcription factor 7 interacting protein 2 n=1 Tax=Suricata suricatta TaxID=37032 RepID=A0A673VCR8_SURSU
MASPDRSKRKILKAKKTMPASCRKQAEILNKSKNVEALQTATRNNNMSSGNQNSNTSIISSKYEQSENAASLLDSNKNSVCSLKSNVLSQNVTKPLETVDSETRSEYVEDQVVCPSQKPSKTIESSRKLLTQETKDSQNTSKNHFECQTDVTRSCFEQREEDCNLKSSLLSGMVQLSKSTVNNTLEDKIINKIGSHLATDSNSELCDKRQGDILSSDISFVLFDKIPELMNSVISNSCPADILKGENSSRSCHSSISDCENVDSIWLSALDVHRNNCHNLKKRMFSENQGNVKRMKTSEQINENICVALERQTAFLEQVKLLIRQEIYSINYKLFDNKLKELTERIGETQCRNKHEAVAHELFVKISKLQRRIRVVLQSQKNCLEPNVLTSNTAHKVTSSETKLDKNPESISSPKERKTSVSSEPSGPSENAREKINLSTEHNAVSGSNNDDVMLISLESPILTAPITSNPTGTGKTKSESSNGSSDAETEVKKGQHLPSYHLQKWFRPPKRPGRWHKMQLRLRSPVSTCRPSQSRQPCCPSSQKKRETRFLPRSPSSE